MNFQDIDEKNASDFNLSVNHPLQTFEWGDFRKKTGLDVIRRGIIDKNKIISGYQFTVHKTPNFPYQIGYFPKGDLPTNEIISDLEETGGEKFYKFYSTRTKYL